MKTRWKILIGLGIFLALAMASAWVTAHRQPESAVEAYKKMLLGKGEKLEISEVVPVPVPAGSNGAPLLEEAFKMVTPGMEDYTNLPPMMQMVAPGKAIVGWSQPDLRGLGHDPYTNSWENAVAAADYNQAGMELLARVAKYPAIDHQLDYTKGPDLLLPHLAPFKQCAYRLTAAAMCDLHAGDTAAATTNICVLLSLVQAARDEHIAISQLVNIAMASLALSASWELLQSTNLTEGELAALQKEWEQQEYIASMEGAFEFERASNDALIQKLRTSKAAYDCLLSAYSGIAYMGVSTSSSGGASSGNWLADLGNFGKEGLNRAKRGSADYLWRTSWSYTDQLHSLQGMQITLEAIRTIETNQTFQPTMSVATTNLNNLHDEFSDSGWMGEFNGWLGGPLRDIFSGGMGYIGSTLRKVLNVEVSRRVVTAAIALKRFQLRHGTFPETLAGLTPEFLASVPLDPVDGKPLRYRRNADGTFLLYSVGEDGVDGGGDVTPVKRATAGSTFNWNWERGRDWVWPQPATAAEIQFFYDYPPK